MEMLITAPAHALRKDLGRARGRTRDDGTCLIYIDRHLVHEVTSPQAFEALRPPAARCAGPN
jgi:3-isopropylmalate/(R)-2-methylmalate dehydratase large subunit